MSRGYKVYENEVLNEQGTRLTKEDLEKLSCVACELLLRGAHQLSCGHYVCEGCKPIKVFECSKCGANIDPSLSKACFPDRYCQKSMSKLMVACRCSEKVLLLEWESHYLSCAEIDHVDQEPLQASDSFPVNKPVEERLKPPEQELGSTSQNISRNPIQASQQKPGLQESLLPTSTNKSATLNSIPVPSPQDHGSIPCGIPISEMVVSHLAQKQEDPWDLNKYIPPGCNPKVLTIINANDSSSVSPSEASSTEPQLDAVKTVNLLKPVLLDCGHAVIPVINKSVRSLFLLLRRIEEYKLPKSIELVIFISTAHGKCDEICMNREYVGIPDLVQRLTEIDCLHFFAIFEGCQGGYGSLHFKKVNKSYTAVYSVPPQCKAYHRDGVGIMTRCLVELLRGPYVKSLKDLIEDLRREVDIELEKVNKPRDHQPVSIHNSLEAINPHAMISSALSPKAEVVKRDGVMVSLKIKVPERLICHPDGEKFELKELQVAIVRGKSTVYVLVKDIKEFGEVWHETVELPPRAKMTTEDLRVIACYKDGRCESSGKLNCELPLLEAPRILSCTKRNCSIDIRFIANQEFKTESKKCDVTSIKWRCQAHEEWTTLEGVCPSDDEQIYPISLPHVHQGDDTVHRIQIRKCYAGINAYMDSVSVVIARELLPTLEQPELIQITRRYCGSGKVVSFLTNKCCDQVEISRCSVNYWISDTESPKFTSTAHHNNEEAEVEIPFQAIKIEPVVEYNSGATRVLGQSCYHSNTYLQEKVHGE